MTHPVDNVPSQQAVERKAPPQEQRCVTRQERLREKLAGDELAEE